MHLKIRLIIIKTATIALLFSTAFSAYSEHDGEYLQLLGLPAVNILYNLIKILNIKANFYHFFSSFIDSTIKLNFIKATALFGINTILALCSIALFDLFAASLILLLILFLFVASPNFLLVIIPSLNSLLGNIKAVPILVDIFSPVFSSSLNSSLVFIDFILTIFFCLFVFFSPELVSRPSFLILPKIHEFFFCF